MKGVLRRRVDIPQVLGEVERLPAGAREAHVRACPRAMGMMPGRGMGMRFLINGREFDHTRIDARVRLGDVEDWEYVNTTGMDHPMHVHTNAFQRVGADGQADPAWLDGVVVPARGRVRIRIRFTDFPGMTVQHCHILDHEDLGMMSTLLIEAVTAQLRGRSVGLVAADGDRPGTDGRSIAACDASHTAPGVAASGGVIQHSGQRRAGVSPTASENSARPARTLGQNAAASLIGPLAIIVQCS